MDFVVACSNIRSFIYNIPQKTRFDVKSMAGNIIPAIATTNAVIAGGIVMEALKIINVSSITDFLTDILEISHHISIKLSVCTSMSYRRGWSILTLAMP